ENDAVGRRVAISDAEGFFNGDNTVALDLFGDALDEEIALDPGYNPSVSNPGHDIEDAVGNEFDPIVVGERLVLLTPPAAEILDSGVAIIDESEKVVEIRLQVSGPVDLNEDGDIAELAQRFFLRGDDFGGPGGDAGDALELGDLIEDIEFSDTANSAGNYTITLHLAEGISFPQ